ncbi:hypothetical protein EGW08_021054 [Elysia chlorotica]|uniref:Uncharacterized protein n=1 Tax=Elysia chlorotica TaxID=188477 RepID=A0A3S0Z5K1_ELYCH|nr:hypothetical protein EGW08_021054 [Elysia chlorotica]
MSALRASGGIPSGPAALPDLRDLMALVISALLGAFVFMLRGSVCDGMSTGVDGAGLFSVSLKCSAHRRLWSSSPGMVFPSLSFMGRLLEFFFPESVLVISYSLFIFLWPAAVSASVVSSSMKVLLSCLALFFTCRFRSQ